MTSSSTSAPAKTKNSPSLGKILGILVIVIGAIMIVSGGVAWGAISSQLKSQEMVVPEDSASNAGKAVAGPFTAWSMQATIDMHASKIADGETYSTLGTKVNEAKEKFGEDSEEAAALQGQRTTVMNASLLRSSLFTSILAFGVSFLVIGVGITNAIIGTGIVVSGRKESAKA